MKPDIHSPKFGVGIAALFALTCALKSIALNELIFGSPTDPRGWHIARLDIPSILVLLILLCLVSAVTLTWLRKALTIGLGLFTIYYFLDTAVVLHFDTHLRLGDLLRFGGEVGLAIQFLTLQHVAIAILGLLALFIRTPISAPLRGILTLAALIGLVLAAHFPPNSSIESAFARYRFPPPLFRGARALFARQVLPYSEIEMARAISETASKPKVDLPPNKPDIVLLIVESLTAVDSFKLSGINDHFPRLDEIAEHGKFFTNFFANYRSSEGGFVSLLTGLSPFRHASGAKNLGRAFNSQPSILHSLKSAGYHSEFLTATHLDFAEQGEFARSIGFDQVFGREEVESFREAPRFGFDSPSDEVLFNEAVNKVRAHLSSKKPFFLTLFTASSHTPYQSPDGREPSEQNVLDYVDHQIERFYTALSTSGFFENGLLIIVGDHHKYIPLSDREKARYGESAIARVPLVILGNGVPRNTLDHRILDQSTLFGAFGTAATSDPRIGTPLTSFAHYVDPDSLNYGDTGAQAQLLIFTQRGDSIDTSPLTIDGRNFTWPKGRPLLGEQIESAIHTQRAALQYHWVNRKHGCNRTFPPPNFEVLPGDRFTVKAYRGFEIDGPMNPARLLSQRSFTIQDLDYWSSNWRELTLPDNSALEIAGTLVAPVTGVYRFRLEADDGACLAINQELVVDANRGLPGASHDAEINLAAGEHSVYVRYFQKKDYASLRLLWMRPGEEQWRVLRRE